MQNGQDDAPRRGGRRLSQNEAAMGFKLDPQMEDRPVGTKTIDDLIYQWHRIYGAAASR